MPSELEGPLERRFFELDWTPSRGMREIAREWLAVQRYPRLEFRDTPAGRRAALREGPEIWEIAAAAGPSRAMSAALGQRFAWVQADALDEALGYAREHRDEIDRVIAREERLAGG
ncbi:MAG: hypothetical protein MJB57_05720 [Gemmatimonadetes bacterium]|nr:hypothetical protein [Gemmatimonadota bacterium]